MQRYSLELGVVDDQHSGCQLILEDVVASRRAHRICDSARHFTEWFSYSRDRASLRERRPANDSQCNP